MKSPDIHLLFRSILLLLNFQIFSGFIFNGFEIKDLVQSDNASFTEEASYWNASALRGSSKYSVCNGTYLLGGFDILGPNSGTHFQGQYFERTYSNLPSHSGIHFSLTFWALDRWDTNKADSFQIQMDSKLLNGWLISNQDFPENLCGSSSFKDLSSIRMFGTVLHSNPTLTLKVIGQLDHAPTQESFGFRDINILFVNVSATTSETMCGLASIPLPNNQCVCPENTYEDPPGSNICLSCDPSCGACFGPSSSECYQCASGKFFNGTDCINCDSSCSICYGTGANQCLTCKPGYFLLNNNTCIPDCDFPLIQTSDGTTDFCESPCSSNQYIYQNGACLSNCDFPLNQSSQYGLKFCSNSCKNDSDFLYWDASCKQSCNIPLVSSVKENIKYCSPPCNNTSDYYYEGNGSCYPYCNSPNKVSANEFYNSCIISSVSTPTLIFEDATIQTTATVTDAGNTAMTISVAVANALGSNNPATFGLAGFVKMLPYIRYLKINYPPRLELLLDNMNGTIISFSFGPSITPETESLFTKYPLPGKFDKYNFHSSFVVNYWQNMGALIIILLVILALSLLEFSTKRCQTINYIVSKLKVIIKWNFFMMIFCTNLDGVVLSTALEAHTLELDTISSDLSFLFCIFMNIFTLFIFVLILHIILDIRKNKSKISPDHNNHPYKKWQGFQSFFVGSKEDLLIRHIFMLPFLLRLYIFNFIVAHLFNYPLLQTILIILMSIFMLVYMIWKRPFKSNLVFCQHTTDELILFVINFCILFLAVLDAADEEADGLRDILGDIIIICNVIFSITANVYLIAYLYVGFKAAINNMKKAKKTGLISFIVALLAPFEAGGMDVEILPDKPTKPNKPNQIVPIIPKLTIQHIENEQQQPKPQDEQKRRTLDLQLRNSFEETKRNNMELQTNMSDIDYSPHNLSLGGIVVGVNEFSSVKNLRSLKFSKFFDHKHRKRDLQINIDDSEACPSFNVNSKGSAAGLFESFNVKKVSNNQFVHALSFQEPFRPDFMKRSFRVPASNNTSLQQIFTPKAFSSTPKADITSKTGFLDAFN